jgi:hypothetical protein
MGFKGIWVKITIFNLIIKKKYKKERKNYYFDYPILAQFEFRTRMFTKIISN